MTRLSVNVNKIATLRNARGGNNPDVEKMAADCEFFGAEGITVHPRPDERHIRYSDVRALKKIVKTEFNIEGYPSQSFNELVLEVKPTQVTLVPDKPDQLTSNHGWDTKGELDFLKETVKKFLWILCLKPLTMPKKRTLTALNFTQVRMPRLTKRIARKP